MSADPRRRPALCWHTQKRLGQKEISRLWVISRPPFYLIVGAVCDRARSRRQRFPEFKNVRGHRPRLQGHRSRVSWFGYTMRRAMNESLVFEGRCWKFGHNIPTDEITPTHVVWKGFEEMAKHVLESLNPEFPKKVQSGDILVAGRNFGCSSGRAIAAKAIKAAGVGVVVADQF